MSTKITLRPLNVGRTFPATWRGIFSGKPTAEEVHEKQTRVQRFMRDELRKQVKHEECSPGFLLDFKWQRTSADPTEYTLQVTTKRDRRHRNGQNADAAPSPKSPPPPPM